MKKRVAIVLATLAVLSLFAQSTVSTAVQGYEGSVLKALSHQGASTSDPATPIQHIIIVMNENHAFDNFYGVFPGYLHLTLLILRRVCPLKKVKRLRLLATNLTTPMPFRAFREQTNVILNNVQRPITTAEQ